jgi:beta-glucosidase
VVKNTGNVTGAEVVQLYVCDRVGSITRPVKELKAFDKITLNPGETKTVTFTLVAENLKFWNEKDQQIMELGDFDLWVGTNSAEGLKTSFVLK